MAPTKPQDDLRQLKRFVKELKKRYLTPHLGKPALGPLPRTEELDVAAFAVLAHGAFENFVEGLALWGVTRIETNWISLQRASRSTAALMMHTNHPTDHAEETRSVFDVLRGAVEAAKTAHSASIKRNHGVEVKHLRSLLSPLGVDIPTDGILIGSLNSLVKMRHQWAHQDRFGARETKSAEETLKTADDCLRLAEQICKNLAAVRR